MIFTDLQHVEHIVNVKHVLHIVFYDQENRVTFHFENKFLSCHVDAQTFKKIKDCYTNVLNTTNKSILKRAIQALKNSEVERPVPPLVPRPKIRES